MAILDQVRAILADIRKEIPDIKAITLAGKDGVPIYSDIGFLSSEGIDEETVSAMGVLIYSTAKKLNTAFQNGTLEELTVTGTDGLTVVYDVGPDAILIMVLPRETNLGLIRIVTKQAAQKLKEILS